MSTKTAIASVVSVLALTSATMLARPPITPPTYAELMQTSDLVCVLQVSQVVESAKPPPANLLSLDLKSYVAVCKVVYAFKGNTTNAEIRIPFYGHLFDVPAQRRAAAPLVETKQEWLERSVQYLAFLTQGKEGMFVPSSGDLDPGFSFRIMLQSFDLEAAKILKERQPRHNESGAADRSQPSGLETNSTSSAAGSRR